MLSGRLHRSAHKHIPASAVAISPQWVARRATPERAHLVEGGGGEHLVEGGGGEHLVEGGGGEHLVEGGGGEQGRG